MFIKSKNDKNVGRMNLNVVTRYAPQCDYSLRSGDDGGMPIIEFFTPDGRYSYWQYETEEERDAELESIDQFIGLWR